MSINQPLLSYDSIQRIRHYVETKFSYLPKEKHADIVADAIIRVVEKQLPPFSDSTKKSISHAIIVNMTNHKRPLLFSDIDQAVADHSLTKEERACFLEWRKANAALAQSSTTAAFDVSREETAIGQATPLQRSLLRGFSKTRRATPLIFLGAFIALFALIYAGSHMLGNLESSFPLETSQQQLQESHEFNSTPVIEQPKNALPAMYQFIAFDQATIKSYLDKRQSLLADEPYFSVIYDTAEQFNIHPVLLFAITGQEQGFVPRDHEQAEYIVQNPFNVFHSWQDYNTTIEDSTAIAARTIINLSTERPEDIDAIKWINRKYAEDKDWHKGVSSLFHTILNHQIHE